MRLPAVSFLFCAVFACADRYEDSVLPLVLSSTGSVQSVLLIGDSLDVYSDGFGLGRELEPGFRVFHRGIINYDFERWSVRLEEAFAAASHAPDWILVPLGTNDAFRFDGSTVLPPFLEFHRQLRIRSNARVVYFRMPRTMDPSIQTRVIEIGTTVASHLPENSKFVDLDALFREASGQPPLYDETEVLHPNERGYAIVRHAMKNALVLP